jgi:hypothetical protein
MAARSPDFRNPPFIIIISFFLPGPSAVLRVCDMRIPTKNARSRLQWFDRGL